MKPVYLISFRGGKWCLYINGKKATKKQIEALDAGASALRIWRHLT